MPTLSTTVDPRSPSYVDSRQSMLVRLDELHEALSAGSYSSRRPVARERVELLLDRDAPFLELCPLAGWGTEATPGAGIVGGIGAVEGVRCMIIANEPASPAGATGLAGAMGLAGAAGAAGSATVPALKKIRRLAEIAIENGLPRIHLLDEAAAARAEDRTAHHRVLRDLVRAGDRSPGIAVVLGPTSTAAAHLAGYSIAVRHAATDETDFRAEDERDAMRLTRLCIGRVNRRGIDPLPAAPPKYDTDELLGLTPGEPHEILARLLDGSEFDEFQPGYGSSLVTGWGELHGHPIGIVAGRAADDTMKAARFIERASTPLLFLDTGDVDEPRFIQAVATSSVPHLTVEVGGGTGRAYRPRFLFRWPGSGALDLSGRLHDDGVLDPRDTRTALGIALAAIREAT
jgi:acetyl-CoA carboxylase carboxyltransferase component